jgi:hypothetical protein
LSKISIEGNVSGTGTLTIAAPNTNSNFTLDIPSASGVIDRLNRAGNVLQVVNVAFPTIFTTTSTSYVDVTGFSASITPTSATSNILVTINAVCGTSNSDGFINLLRDSTNIAQGTGGSTSNQTMHINGNVPTRYGMLMASVVCLDSPATTSSVTYKLQVRSTASTTVRIGGRGEDSLFGGYSSITLMEIAA